MKYWRTPLDREKVKTSKGRLYLIQDRCKGCGFCVEFCPKEILEESKDINKKGYHPPVVNEHDCLYCEICELICPEFSIYCVDENSVSGESTEVSAEGKAATGSGG